MAKTRTKSLDIIFIQKLYSDWLESNQGEEIKFDEISDVNKTATVWRDGDLVEVAGIRKNADDEFVFFQSTFEFEF